MNDAIERAHRWKAFYDEPQGLKDMFEASRKLYFEQMGKLEPYQTKEIAALAMANKINKEIENHVVMIISQGDIIKSQNEHVDKIRQWNTEKPSFLQRFNPHQ